MPDRFDAANRAKHGLPLIFGDEVLADDGLKVIPSVRPIDGEERFKGIGMVGGKLYTAGIRVAGWRAAFHLCEEEQPWRRASVSCFRQIRMTRKISM
jgi:hypothetical protein